MAWWLSETIRCKECERCEAIRLVGAVLSSVYLTLDCLNTHSCVYLMFYLTIPTAPDSYNYLQLP